MKKTALALGAAASIALVGSAAPLASASAGLHVTISPKKPTTGQTVKIHATGARKNNNSYVCIETIGKPGVKESSSLANLGDVDTPVKSNAQGVVNCKLPFLPFSKTYKGKSISCPPTKAEKKAGWYCGDAVANAAHRSEFAVARFSF